MRLRIKLFDIYIILITFFKGIGADADSKVYVFAFCVGCYAIFLKMIQERFTQRELLSVASIVLIGVADYLFGNTTTILFTAIAICGLKNVDCRRIIKIVLWVRIVSFLCMVICSTTGLIENEIFYFNRGGIILERYMFGYDHPNLAHLSLAIIITLVMYVYSDKMGLWHYFLLMCVNVTMYFFTYSRTGLLLCFIGVLLHGGLKHDRTRGIVIKWLKHLYVLMIILTFTTGLFFEDFEFLESLDKMLTGRIGYNHQLLTNFFPPIIGSNLYDDYITFDNGFLILLYKGGILAFAWFSYYQMKLINKICNEKRYFDFFLITVFIIYSFTESFFPSISVNIALLLLGEVIYEKKGKYNYSVLQCQ